MTGLTVPILLAILGVAAAIVAYRGVQRGNSSYYQLERNTLLRRASFYQLASMVLFIGATLLLAYNYNLVTAVEDEDDSAVAAVDLVVTPTATEPIIAQPPTIFIEPSPTPDGSAPTLTPTPLIRRAEIRNTGGSGAYLRESPSTTSVEIQVLDEGTLVTLIDEEPVAAEGYNWIHVRTLGGVDGYVVEIYLEEFER